VPLDGWFNLKFKIKEVIVPQKVIVFDIGIAS
jgi:hypothetical protein